MKLAFKAKVWIYPGGGTWHFVSIDKKDGLKIKKNQTGKLRRGWGAVKVEVTLGKSKWTTSIFPVKDGTYLLPIKSEIRKKEGVFDTDTIHIKLAL